MGWLSAPKPNPQYTKLQQENAGIAREQYDDFKTRFQSQQDSLNNLAGSSGGYIEAATKAGDMAGQQFDNSAAESARNRSRLGVNLSPDQQAALKKKQSLNRSLAVVGAKNDANQTESERRRALMQTMMGINRGQANEALGEFASAGQMEAQAGISDMNQRTAKHQQNMGTLGSIASLGAMALILSSKEAKTKIKPLDTRKAAQEVNSMDLKNYSYKKGKGPAGKRAGVIAEEAPQDMTRNNRQVVSLGDWTAKNTAAIQEMSKQVKSINKKIQSLDRG